MTKEQIIELEGLARNIRKNIIEQTYCAKSGHPGGSLSIADILAYLYKIEMNIDPQNPDKEDRDRLILSKGHTSPALYGVLAEMGYFDKSELKLFRKPNAMLQGHPDMKGINGVDMSSGSLGQGLSVGAGICLGAKMDKKDFRTYVILGDGEIQEGQIWEALMFSSHNKLDNLVVILDNNNLQIDGTLEEVVSPYPLVEKFVAFGFNVVQIDGHNFTDIENAIECAKNTKNKPTLILAKTIKGKGVSFMEHSVSWHGTAPNEEQYNNAMNELNG